MAGKTFSIEDVIADEVRKAVSAQRPVPMGVTAAAEINTGTTQNGGGGGDILGGLDIKSITGLLREVNIMMQNKNGAPADGAPAPVGGAPAPAGLPGVDATPAFNPAPGAPAPAGIEPEKVYDLVLSSIDQIKAVIGDATLSEVAGFMTDNKAVVVSLIGQEIAKL